MGLNLVLLFALFGACLATTGVDVSTAVSLSTWSCLGNSGMQFAIIRVCARHSLTYRLNAVLEEQWCHRYLYILLKECLLPYDCKIQIALVTFMTLTKPAFNM